MSVYNVYLTQTWRFVKHPAFKAFGSKDAENYLALLQHGDAMIRPSSKGADHLTVTWKVADGVYQHMYICEHVRMASLYSALFVCVCISLLLHSHVAKYYATTAYASHENSKGTDYITDFYALPITFTHELLNLQWERTEDTTPEAWKKP